MKVVIAHTRYENRGGEDLVFENESKLLSQSGVKVIKYEKDNTNLKTFWRKFAHLFNCIYSFATVNEVRYLIKKHKPEVLHVHNFHAVITPSIFYISKKMGLKTIFTCHNYRIICPTATFMFNGEINETSLKYNPFWTIRKKVYKNSYIMTTVLAVQIYVLKKVNFWNTYVDTFICLTAFQRQKFQEFGIDSEKIEVKGNMTLMPPIATANVSKVQRNFYVFIGRLSEEKGVAELVKFWQDQKEKLYIIGDGPLKVSLQSMNRNKNIIFKGFVHSDKVKEYLAGAIATIMCSKWYEGFPMTILESFSQGTPVIVPNLGSMPELIETGRNGFVFDEIGELADIKNRIDKAMYENTIAIFNEKYNLHNNVEELIAIYKK